MKNRVFILLNLLLAVAMIVRLAFAVYVHSRHPEWSAPASVELIKGVYYIIPFAVLNLTWLVCRRRRK